MKIQSTTSKSLTTKTKGSKKPSGAFGALFASQTEEKQEVVSTPEQKQEQSSSEPKQANIEQSLHTLESAVQSLDSITENPQQAQDAITDLRDALKHMPLQSNLSQEDLQEADTLLAVEAKRLETLSKYK